MLLVSTDLLYLFSPVSDGSDHKEGNGEKISRTNSRHMKVVSSACSGAACRLYFLFMRYFDANLVFTGIVRVL